MGQKASKQTTERIIQAIVQFGKSESSMTKAINKGRKITKVMRYEQRRAIEQLIEMMIGADMPMNTQWLIAVVDDIVEELG